MRLLGGGRLEWVGGGGLLALLLGAGAATAQVSLSAEPVFPIRLSGDRAPLSVEIRNAGTAGVFVLTAASLGKPVSPLSRLEVELAAGARKRVTLLAWPSNENVAVRALRDGRELARVELRVREHAATAPLYAVLGPAPADIARGLRDEDQHAPWREPGLMEVELDRLPEDPLHWPELDLLIWPAPRSTDLRPAQALALERWLVRGGRLLAGATPEEPDALERLGIGEEAGLRVRADGGLELRLVGALAERHRGLSAAGDTSEPRAIGARLGWGHLTRVPADLSRRAPDGLDWRTMAELAIVQRPRLGSRPSGSARAMELVGRVLDDLVSPPLGSAVALLLCLFVVAVPGAVVSGRRARRGRRLRRSEAWQYPAALAVATALGYLLAHAAAPHGLAVARIDVVDLDVENGWARAASFVALRRAGAGDLTVTAPPGARVEHHSGRSARRLEPTLRQRPPSFSAELDCWEPLYLRVDSFPAASDLPAPALDLAALQELGALGARSHAPERGWRTLIDEESQDGGALDRAVRVVSGQWWLRSDEPADSLERALLRFGARSLIRDSDRNSPSFEPQLRLNGTEVLLVAVPGSFGAPLLVDGRAPELTAMTLYRYQLPAGTLPTGGGLVIEVRRLHVRYPRTPRPAVSGVSFEVQGGQVHGFIGPNGAGKTTTLKVLAGLLSPSSGQVRVAGRDVLKEPDAVRGVIGFLPDFFGVPEGLTCHEYLELFAALQGLPEDRRRPAIRDVLELTDLVGKVGAPAASLSRGMQQRLGLARVLLHQPEVLLLDEPASGLDPRARVEVREVLSELGRMGKTIFVSSHVLSDLAAICDSIGIMEQGQLLFSGTVEAALVRARELAPRVVLAAALEGPERLLEALEADPELDVRVGPGEEGLVRVLPREGNGGQSTDDVARAVQRAGLSLSHLEEEVVDLERAFLTLTRGRLA